MLARLCLLPFVSVTVKVRFDALFRCWRLLHGRFCVVVAVATAAGHVVAPRFHQLFGPFLFWVCVCVCIVFVCFEPQGREHLQAAQGTVLVANHQSVLDAFLFSILGLSLHFKVVIKREIIYYPGVGQIFMLAKHILVQRGNKSSGKQAMADSEDWINRNVSVLFFPEGTRKVKGVLGEFKKGAFYVRFPCLVVFVRFWMCVCVCVRALLVLWVVWMRYVRSCVIITLSPLHCHS